MEISKFHGKGQIPQLSSKFRNPQKTICNKVIMHLKEYLHLSMEDFLNLRGQNLDC